MGTQALKSIERNLKTGGARRDRTADLLHAMQALSQLSYGPTWRRGTLPEAGHFVKKMNKLRAPDGSCAGQSSQRLDFTQNSQGGIDGRRDRSATHREANGLCEFTQRNALRRREPA